MGYFSTNLDNSFGHQNNILNIVLKVIEKYHLKDLPSEKGSDTSRQSEENFGPIAEASSLVMPSALNLTPHSQII